MARERSSMWDRLLEATRSSIGWTAAAEPPAGDPAAVRIAMRSLLLEAGGGRGDLRVACAIDRCTDVRGLWYLRAPLMQALSRQRGEREARLAVEALDPLFRDGWPEAPVSRRSFLG